VVTTIKAGCTWVVLPGIFSYWLGSRSLLSLGDFHVLSCVLLCTWVVLPGIFSYWLGSRSLLSLGDFQVLSCVLLILSLSIKRGS